MEPQNKIAEVLWLWYNKASKTAEGETMKETVLITGGSRGIGAAAARLFAAEGYRVVICCQKEIEKARTLAASLPDACAYQADVSDEAAVNAMIEEIGRVDVLVNNAGIAMQKLFTDTTAEDWERIFRVNVTGMFYTCRAVLPGMIRRQSGRIVNISSMWGETGASCEVAYSASKAAVIGLTKALAKEVGLSGVTVNCVSPGVIETDMNQNLTDEDKAALCDETPLNRIGTAEEAAQAILFLASERASFITGQILGVNGGIVI